MFTNVNNKFEDITIEIIYIWIERVRLLYKHSEDEKNPVLPLPALRNSFKLIRID